MKALALVLLLALNAAAQSVTLVGARVYAPTETVKPIFLEVRVRNTASVPIDGVVVLYRFVPQPPLGYVKTSEVDMFSPYEGELEVGPLEPQETRTLTLQTRYYSPSAFSTTSRSFYTAVLVPGLGRSSGPTKINYGLKLRESSP